MSRVTPTASTVLTLVIAPDTSKNADAFLFVDNLNFPLTKAQLVEVRKTLPTVRFIKSALEFADQIPLHSLLKAYRPASASTIECFDFATAQDVARLVSSFVIDKQNPTLDAANIKALANFRDELQGSKLSGPTAELELQLFRDVLGITDETIDFVNSLPIDDRTHADGLVEQWNREIEERLNLAHYWTQDDSFALRLNYKQGLLYFEIKDKTGATYTFREQSSGLRFFLSYYIQAKALEYSTRDGGAIVLMDEPDSFLSIIGQRNLLAVFESLVKAESSGQKCQLVYTTHSPFLINRNFPHRLRLVRKGDAEEGTQLIDKAMLRRYEPVRSALGIDCSQTLFMGATNVVVEGPSDQYILSELVRHFARPDNINELLDLNSIVMVSAESAPSVEKLLAASQWGDEAVPATIVLLDSDGAGDDIRKRITGVARNCKKLIDDEFVLQIRPASGLGAAALTTEDIIPQSLFRQSVINYVERWWSDIDDEAMAKFKENIGVVSLDGGCVGAVNGVLNDFVHDTERTYDKYGVLVEVMNIIHSGKVDPEDLEQLKKNILALCESIRRAISSSQQAARRETGKQAVQRLIKDFFIQHKEMSSVFDVQLLLERIQRDLQLLGEDGEKLDGAIKRLVSELKKLRTAGQNQLSGENWESWGKTLAKMEKNPLNFSVSISEGVPTPRGESEVATATLPRESESKSKTKAPVVASDNPKPMDAKSSQATTS